ncbi:MAG: type II toxin-antitoxin system VapC family toxin [Verrucomicrobiales bacterium]|nr:type II toxin-antitoxin system VapC family toxin [Verrucomicrobiales bacterium]
MKIFTDTSFLCALYRKQDNTQLALDIAGLQIEPLIVSELVLFEVRQSARLQVFNFNHDRTKGFPAGESQRLLEKLALNIQSGVLVTAEVDWRQVHRLAEKLSEQHTVSDGHRTMDVLHVATALQVKATHLYTFDENQARLAKKVGLKINLK